MTTRRAVTTPRAPAPAGAYSQGILAGGFLHSAGLGPHDPSSGEIVGTTVAEQTAQVMRNLAAILEAHDLSFADVVKATVHLADLHADFAGFNSTYGSFLQEPYPARTTVGSTLAPNMLVEIDVVALAGEKA